MSIIITIKVIKLKSYSTCLYYLSIYIIWPVSGTVQRHPVTYIINATYLRIYVSLCKSIFKNRKKKYFAMLPGDDFLLKTNRITIIISMILILISAYNMLMAKS